MTTLDKLSIQGVRSYDPNAPVVMNFFKPLTMIVGTNGSGKTTIIEALKYATSGTDPPNADKGKNWVHDTKLASSATVKAKVMLGFSTASKSHVIVSKALQVTQQKKKKTFKTLDTTISIQHSEGKKEQITCKCADSARLVPHIMSVTKALLDNVIFASQDEALWPLDDDRQLKARFDDVFAATKYSKAVDALKIVRKKHNSVAKKLSHELDLLASDHLVASKLERELHALEETMAHLESDKASLEHELARFQEEHDRHASYFSQVEAMEIRTKDLQRDLDYTRKEYANMVADDDPTMDLSLDEIAEKQRRNREREDALQREIASLTLEKTTLEEQRGQYEVQMREKSKDLGRFEIAKEELNSLSLEYDGRYVAHEARMEALGHIKAMLSDEKQNQTELQKEQSTLKMQCSNVVNSATSKVHDIDLNLSRTISLRDSALESAVSIQSQLKDLDHLDFSKASHAHQQLEQRQRELQVVESTMRGRDFEKELEELQSSKSNIETELLQQQHRAAALRQASEGAMRYSIALESLKEGESRLNAVLSDCGIVSEQELESAATTSRERKSQLEQEKRSQEQAVSRYQVEIDAFKSRIREAEELKCSNERQMKMLASTLEEVQQEHSFPDGFSSISFLSELEEQYRSLDKQASLNEPLQQYFESGLAHLHEQRKCILCERTLQKKQGDKFKERLETLIGSDETRSSQQDHLQMLDKQIGALRDIQPMVREYERVASEVVEIHKRLSRFRIQVESLQRDLHSTLQEKEKIENEALSHQREATLLDECIQCRDHTMDLRGKCSSLKHASNDASGDSMEQIQQAIHDIEARLKETQLEIKSVDEEQYSLRKQQLEVSQSINALSAEAAKLESQMNDAAKLKQRFDEDTNKAEGYQKEVNAYESAKKEAANNLSRARSVCSKQEQDMEESIKAASSAVLLLEKQLQQLEQYHTNMSKTQGLMESLSASKQEYDTVFNQSQVLSERRRSIERHIVAADDSIAECRSVLKAMESSRRQKELQTRQEQLEMELQSHLDMCRRKLGDGLDSYKNKMKEAEDAMNQTSSQLYEIKGMQRSNQDRLRQLQRDLASPKYVDIEKRLRVASLRHHAAVLSAADAETYANALDKALMRFHGRKMEEINQVLRNLWQMTYRGRDIDFIEIQSDQDDSKSKKQYSYRVAMVYGNKSIPMRGRCSAGQRVLACILIRMALAETFCINCGVLALDEPTTNLDSRNIRSLADSLRSIIERRRDQRSFQLLIITHDEEFLRYLGAREYTDYYYLVSKNSSNYSTIAKQPMFG